MMKTALLLLALAVCACAHAQTANPAAFSAMPPSTWRHVYQKGSLVICEAQMGGQQGHGLAIANATLAGNEIMSGGSVLVRFVGAPSSAVSYSYAGGVCIITYQ